MVKILEIETIDFSNYIQKSSSSSIISQRCHKLLSLMPTSQELRYTLAISLSYMTPFPVILSKGESNIQTENKNSSIIGNESKKQIDWSSLFGIIRNKGFLY
jgi:hypothetical protein